MPPAKKMTGVRASAGSWNREGARYGKGRKDCSRSARAKNDDAVPSRIPPASAGPSALMTGQPAGCSNPSAVRASAASASLGPG